MYFYKTKNCFYSLAKEKMFCKFSKIMRRFWINRCFKGWFSTNDCGIWNLEVSDDTPVYNPKGLPLNKPGLG